MIKSLNAMFNIDYIVSYAFLGVILSHTYTFDELKQYLYQYIAKHPF